MEAVMRLNHYFDWHILLERCLQRITLIPTRRSADILVGFRAKMEHCLCPKKARRVLASQRSRCWLLSLQGALASIGCGAFAAITASSLFGTMGR
jgi:hypothetical protein